MIKFDWLGSKGSYLANNDNLGIVTGSLSFTRLEKGNCLILTSGNSITWTINSVDITNIISYIRGIGTYRVTLNANNTDVSLTNTIWNFQNSVVNALGITSVTVTATSGTVYLNRLVLLNGDYEVDNLETYFENSSPTEKDIRGFEYPKPTDLSNESGLVAAYSFSPETVSNGKLLDISGNGNHGTISGALLTKEGMKFIPEKGYIELNSDISLVNNTTICIRVKRANTDAAYLLSSTVGGARLLHLHSSSNALTLYNDTLATLTGISKTDFSDLVVAISGTTANTYMNGCLINSVTLSGSLNTTIRQISTILSTRTWDNIISDLKVYNYTFTPTQAAAYHNSFIKPYLILDFSDEAVGNTI